MTLILENSVLNDVLCYISSARDSMTCEDIILTAAAFYKHEVIKLAKECIFEICKEKLIVRRQSKEFPNPAIHDLQDIMDLLVKMEGRKSVLPNFLANGHMSMPPQSGFQAIARMMGSLRDELASVKIEMAQFREARQSDVKSLNDITSIHQDIIDIKTMLNNTNGVPINNPNLNKEKEISASTSANNNPNITVVKVPGVGELNETPNRYMSFATAVQSNSCPSNNVVNISRPSPNAKHITSPNDKNKSDNKSHTEWSTVSTRNQRRPQRNKALYGTKIGDDNLLAAPRTLDVYVGGCSIVTTEDILSEYCVKRGGFDNIKCSQISVNERSKAFKVGVLANDRDKLLNPEFWPIGVWVRKFYRLKKNFSNARVEQ